MTPEQKQEVAEELADMLKEKYGSGVFSASALVRILREAYKDVWVEVTLFKDTGKYYTSEKWRMPTREEAEEHPGYLGPGDMHGPFCMLYSPDFRRIGGTGRVLVDAQEPWGYPHLL